MLENLLKKLNIKVNNIDLYRQAFIHRSYVNENPKHKLTHNEKLEFFGDAVLELATTEYLFMKYKHLEEGDLTAKRSAIVNTNSLGKVAEKLGFNEYLKLSKGEARDTGKARVTILADTFEAFLGAMYFDNHKGSKGLDICLEFLKQFVFVYEKELEYDSRLIVAKSLVQEISQDKYSVTPRYKVISEVGRDHDKTFKMGVYINDKLIAEGIGKSKHEAETSAAQNALIKNKWI